MFNSEIKDETIDDIAARWCMRKMSGNMTAVERDQLEEWLSESHAHQEAFDAFMAVEDMTAEAADAIVSNELEKDLYAYAHKSTSVKPWRLAVSGIAASVALILVASMTLMTGDVEPVTYATLKGERADYTLSDGSVASLNTDSEISYYLDKNERRVVLERGEVLFDVVRDIDRPFIVDSLNAKVVVLGTRFSVRASEQDVVVSVLSGVVLVGAAQDTSSDNNEVTLIAGQQAALDAENGAIDVDRFNPDAAVSWQLGRALYEDETLAYVVTDLNRYFPAKLVVADDALNDIRVTGGFDLTDQSVAVEALSVALSLRAEQSGQNKILLFADD